jgi:hypothetical protein
MAFAAMALTSCSMYHKRFEVTDATRAHVDFVIQADDVGKFWNPEDADAALAEIAKSARSTNTLVVVFVHGWHHNANSSDQNLKDFQGAMAELRERLRHPVYAESRRALTQTSDFRAIGVYLGWRGRSLPSFADYATFWGRKAAAERVGEGDFREFMQNLNRIYEAANADFPPAPIRPQAPSASASSPFMGLVSIGHSFGGQVLLRATQPTIEANLIAAGATGKRTAITEVPISKPVKGFGDLVILVNPATEALQFDRIDRLNKSLRYTRSQPPLMFVISAASDGARNTWFPLGRLLDASIRADLRPEVRDMWGHALGSFPDQWTHEATIVGKPDVSWNFDPENVYVKEPCKLIAYDLTGSPEFLTPRSTPDSKEGVLLTRLNDAHPYSPFVVANIPTPKDGALALMVGHVQIWEKVFGTFITNYAALAQGKRILLRKGVQDKCPVQ